MVEPATTFAQTKKGRERPLFLRVDFHKKRAKSRALISSANMLIWCGKDRSLTFKQSLDFRSRSYELQSMHANPFWGSIRIL